MVREAEYVSFTATAEDAKQLRHPAASSDDKRSTYTILPKEVTVSGDIRFTTESRPGSAEGRAGAERA